MATIAFYDTETNGLLGAKVEKDGTVCPPLDRLHCVAIIQKEGAKEDRISAADQPSYSKGDSGRGWRRMGIVDALRLLEQADTRVTHNGQDFDERAIKRVYPWWQPKPGSIHIDTLILSRLIYPDIAKSGPNSYKLPPFLRGSHSLKAWGIRLGVHKGDYTGGWDRWSEDMQEYMEQDDVVLVSLFMWLMAQKPAAEASGIEHEFAAIIRRQESRGFGFDEPKALTLVADLRTRAATLEKELIEAFGEWWVYGKAANSQAKPVAQEPEDDEDYEDEEVQEERRKQWEAREEWAAVVIPTVTRRTKMLGFPDITVTRFSPKTGKEIKPYVGPPLCEFTQGHAYTPIKRVQFNPGSRAHIWQRLMFKYGWKPSKFTKGGKNAPPQPVVNDDVLRGLPYPEAQLLANYYLVSKRLGQVADGRKAWLKASRETVLPNGERRWRIHGRMITNGAVTGRCTHMDPNMSQVPKNTAAFKICPAYPEVQGFRCRDLFIAGDGYGLVGFDGSSLELRMLAHYVMRWDNGQYAEIVDKGRHAEGTDPHSWMRTEIVGEDIIGKGEAGRDNAKTAIYAYLYGGGDEKIGEIVLPTAPANDKRALGKEIKAKLLDRFHALNKLKAAIEETVEDRKYLVGLDGRRLNVRKPHAALNTLLQSAGAVVMKKTLIVLDADLRADGLSPGTDYEFVANIHDEAQAEVLPDRYPLYQRLALEAHPKAGTQLRVQCPLKAEVSPLARSWKETH